MEYFSVMYYFVSYQSFIKACISVELGLEKYK